ncbi:MAG: L,D-transpeptidase [Polyangiaceae bacterium]|nr:L,D-transpeptidase [Polyangiaceae bacterium]
MFARVLSSCVLGALVFVIGGCDEAAPPPGADATQSKAAVAVATAESLAHPPAKNPPEQAASGLGTAVDNLPFQATGDKLASIAWRTWVYTDTGPKRTRFGYLRAGAVVDRRGPVIHNDGCAGGWYRVNPRGFVCIGHGATTDLQHPVVLAHGRRAERGQGLPYLYALSRSRPPHLYFKLPSEANMKQVEGGFRSNARRWLGWLHAHDLQDMLDVQTELPDHLNRPLTKPYGVKKPLRFATHAGKASPDSGFAILSTYKKGERFFGLTTELDWIALDRTRLVEPSSFHGVALDADESLPVAFVKNHSHPKYKRSEDGQLHAVGAYAMREGIKLTGEVMRVAGTFWETRDGHWVPQHGLRMVKARTKFPSVATGTRKWIDVSIRRQTLVAYRGEHPTYVTLISSGRGLLGDPEKVPSTILGTFMIHSKHVSSTMDGADDKSDSFNLRDVPFVQYFHKGYALHGTYWHDDFGRVRSHGCINLSPVDAAWLFEWTDPNVFPDWHSTLNKERGTVVHIHP